MPYKVWCLCSSPSAFFLPWFTPLFYFLLFLHPTNSCLSSIFSLMSICWLLGWQKYVEDIAFVLVQSEVQHYDHFRALALRYPTFFSLISFLIMVVIVGFKYRSSFSILVFAWLTATRICALSQKGSCISFCPSSVIMVWTCSFFLFPCVWDLECSY